MAIPPHASLTLSVIDYTFIFGEAQVPGENFLREGRTANEIINKSSRGIEMIPLQIIQTIASCKK